MRGLSLLYYTICWVLKRGNEHSYSKGAVHGVHSCLFTFFKEFLLLLTFDIPHVFLASVGLCFFCSCILLGPTLQIYIYISMPLKPFPLISLLLFLPVHFFPPDAGYIHVTYDSSPRRGPIQKGSWSRRAFSLLPIALCLSPCILL